MKDFRNQKITFLLGYVVIILTIVQSNLFHDLNQINFILFGFVVHLSHLIYFHLSMLGLSILFYSLYFIKENRFNLTRVLAEIFYALSFIIILGFLTVYSINLCIFYLSNFFTVELLIIIILILIILSLIYLSISSVRYIKSLAINIKNNLNASEQKNKTTNRKSYQLLKILIDKLLSLIFLWSVIPILIISTIFIFSQTKGKVIHSQTRIGRNGRRFKLLKFMTIKKSEKGEQFIKLGKIELGKLLRRASIDELPVVFNLIKGDISLVGPRPLPESQFDNVANDSFKKLYPSVKPGLISLTSLLLHWQDLKIIDIYKIETYYIINRGLKLDLSLLLASFSILTFSRFPTK